jgi:hypothetical protein
MNLSGRVKQSSNFQINTFSNFIQFEDSNFFGLRGYLITVVQPVACDPDDIAVAVNQ